ncbi:hypothetical protein ISTM_314 [Insectomime virus]|nr:hypothetical protein ISTM_314 [Insectomime virus]
MFDKTTALLNRVEEYLQKHYLLSRNVDYERHVKTDKHFTGLDIEDVVMVSISIRLHKLSRWSGLCCWEECEKSKFIVYGCRSVGENETLEVIKRVISNNYEIRQYEQSYLYSERIKNRALLEEKEHLMNKIRALKEKNIELKYRPEGYGALRAKQHFESLRS